MSSVWAHSSDQTAFQWPWLQSSNKKGWDLVCPEILIFMHLFAGVSCDMSAQDPIIDTEEHGLSSVASNAIWDALMHPVCFPVTKWENCRFSYLPALYNVFGTLWHFRCHGPSMGVWIKPKMPQFMCLIWFYQSLHKTEITSLKSRN